AKGAFSARQRRLIMNTIIQVAIGAVLKFLWTKLKQAVAKVVLKLLLPGYAGAQKCGDAEQAKQSTQNIEVTVKVGDDVVTVKVGKDENGEQSPESQSLAITCRLPVCKERLIKLLQNAAKSH